jgi:hypothetical protein
MKFAAAFNTFLRDEVNLNQTRLDRLQCPWIRLKRFWLAIPLLPTAFLT